MDKFFDASLREVRNKQFIRAYRAVLTHRYLNPGQKLFLFAVLDNPRETKIINAKISRKLGVSPQQISKWRISLGNFSAKKNTAKK